MKGLITRRRFFFLSGAGLTAATGWWYFRKPVRVALVGAGMQGTNLARGIANTRRPPGRIGQLVAVCDVDQNHATKLRDAFCAGAEIYSDYRKVLERDDVDAVVVATPDHWHARIATDALQAGKAVYGEKPLGLTVAEGRMLVEAVEHTAGVFQGGTMQRTHRRFITACDLVRAGELGKIHTVTVTLPERWKGESQGPFPTTTPPAHLDWERWLGQAPLVGYAPQRCHGFFRRWFEYSGGQLTDWGAHHLDVVLWALNLERSGPLTVQGSGDLPKVANGFNTPLSFNVEYTFPGEVQVKVGSHPDHARCGVRFEGDRAWLEVSRSRLVGSALGSVAWLKSRHGWVMNPFAAQLQQFFACIRDGATPISSVESMHRSSTVCHLGNIAIRLGRKLRWDSQKERIHSDPDATALLSRPQRSPYGLPGMLAGTS